MADTPILSPVSVKTVSAFRFDQARLIVVVPQIDQNGQEIGDEDFEQAVNDKTLPPAVQRQLLDTAKTLMRLKGRIA